ncbi:MAG: transglycosylase SLT domain-containing protein [Methylophaga sp.]|nr:transglycosylase SLT domain-containing protein [Methylophaga sp.]
MTALKWILWSSLYLLYLSPTITFATTNSTALTKQRIIFQQAKNALETNQISRFHALQSQLNDYPLQPYLEYLYLRHRLSQISNATIIQFLSENKDTFYAERLRSAWLDKLAKTKQWQTFLDIYHPPQSVSRQCLRLQALIATNQHELALKDTPELWLSAKSLPSSCNSAFKLWQDKGLLTNEFRRQRIQLALLADQYSLALYLAKSLPDATQAKAEILSWQKMHNNPLTSLRALPSSRSNILNQDTAMSRDIIEHGIARLARKSTNQAHQSWQRIAPAYSFSEQEKDRIQSSIGKRAALSREDRTLEFYGDAPAQPWRARAALWQQDWPGVQRAISSLNYDDKQSTRWQYWLGRSQEELGDKAAADSTYQGIIMQRDYYAFLAADKLSLPYQMNHNPIISTEAGLDIISQQPAILRLKEFYALNMTLEARRQAYKLIQTRTSRELQLIATLTHRWSWHNQTIALLGKAKYWDALDLRFPVVYKSAVLKEGKKNNLDPAWLLGVIRQESAFNAHARSRVGASGLMQLMPKTATLIAKLIKQPLKKQSELLNSNRNIQLGSAYLSKMYNDNQYNPVLATASYNAGPHRVKKWLPKKQLAADIWIENIPFNETRKYTSNVLSYAAIFEHQLKRPITPLHKRMPAIDPKKP